MKKVLAAVMSAALIFLLTACSGSDYETREVNGGLLITKYKGSGSSVNIPEQIDGKTVTELWIDSFKESRVKNVTIPEGVTEIGACAFYKCFELSSITIPDSITRIGAEAFSQCEKLTEIKIPSGIERIENFTFMSCTGLTSIDIPNGVTRIGYAAFEDCTSLKTVNIPDSVTVIEDEAFALCSSLESIFLPDGLNEIGGTSFSRDNNISVTYKGKTYGYEQLRDLYAAING